MNNHQLCTGDKPYLLEARELAVVLGGQEILTVPSLGVLPNEVLVVIGPNGSGKTTLLQSLALLLKPAAGTIYYRGQPVYNGSHGLQLRRKFAVVFQEPLLLDTTVWNNVTLGMRLREVGKDETKKRAHEWLERFGIIPLAQRRARTLSWGEAKRVSLARAFALEPEIIFLDEPFTGLDSPTRQALIEDFESVLRETKVTTVMVTHDRTEALALSDRVAVLIDGEIRMLGTPEDVFSTPVDDRVASFVEAGNVLHGTVSSHIDGLAEIDVGGLRLHAVSNVPDGTSVIACLHYEDITLLMPSQQMVSSSARNKFIGKVVKIFPLGSQVRVTIDCGFPLTALITRMSADELKLEPGKQVYASFKATAIHVIGR